MTRLYNNESEGREKGVNIGDALHYSGRALREWRERQGVEARIMARRLNVGYSTYMRYEADFPTSYPSLEACLAIARATGRKVLVRHLYTNLDLDLL